MIMGTNCMITLLVHIQMRVQLECHTMSLTVAWVLYQFIPTCSELVKRRYTVQWSLAAVQDLAEHQLLLLPHQQEVHCPHPFNNHYRLNVIQMPYILKSRHWCFPLDTTFWFWLSIQFGLVPRNNAIHIQLPPGYPCTNYCFVIRSRYQLPYNLPSNWLSSFFFAITQSGSTRASVAFLVSFSERKLRRINIHIM